MSRRTEIFWEIVEGESRLLHSRRNQSRLIYQIKWRALALLMFLLVLSGCSSGGNSGSNQAVSPTTNARFSALAKENHFKLLRTLRVSSRAITATSTAAPAGPTPFTATGSFALPVTDFGFTVSELFGTLLFHDGFNSQDPARLPPAQSFASTALVPTVSADEQFVTNSLVDGGITLTLRNDQNQDSYTFADLPSGSNVTYLSNDTVVNPDGTTTWDWFASITFASGWTVVVGQDVFFDPGTGFGGFEQFSRQMWFVRPNLPQITVDNATVVHGDSPQNTTTLNFQISTSNNTLNAWSVAAVQNGTTLKSFTPTVDIRGPGVTNGSNPLNVSLTWDAVDSSNKRVAGNFNWVVTANTTNFVAGGPVNDGVNSTQVVVADATASVTIENATATPANFAAGEKSTLSFDINVQGLVQPTTYWLVSIKDSSNTTVLTRSVLAKSLQANSIIINPPPNPFFTFEQGTNTDGRTMVHVVMLPWDGKGGPNNTNISGPFTWVIDAQATSASVSTPVVAQAVLAANDKVSSITVIGPEDTTLSGANRVLSKFRASWVLPVPPKGSVTQLRALRKVWPANEVWQVRVEGMAFNQTLPPQNITLKMHSTISNVDQDVTLTRTGEGIYENGAVTLNSTLFRSASEMAANTTYFISKFGQARESVVDAAGAFVTQVLGRPSTAFPLPQIGLGILNEDARSNDALARSATVATASPLNFLSAGFEAVELVVSAANLTTPIQALVKVRNPALLFVANHHGDQDGSLEMGADESNNFVRLIPQAGMFGARPITKTLGLVSCSALDLNDYNNFSALNGASSTIPIYPPNTGVEFRKQFGGRKWWKAFCQNRPEATMFGYCAPAPAVGCPVVMKGIGDLLSSGNTTGWNASPGTNILIKTWMLANYVYGNVGTAGNTTAGDPVPFTALNACAYDDQNYYFISYRVPKLSGYAVSDPTFPLEPAGIYQVAKGDWDAERLDWAESPPTDLGTRIGP